MPFWLKCLSLDPKRPIYFFYWDSFLWNQGIKLATEGSLIPLGSRNQPLPWNQGDPWYQGHRMDWATTVLVGLFSSLLLFLVHTNLVLLQVVVLWKARRQEESWSPGTSDVS